MRIQSVHLDHFRNYERLDLEVKPFINVFYGQNAQGKTNIIEAIYLCACARSHRTSRDRELIAHGSDHYGVKIILCSEESNEFNESVSLSFYDEGLDTDSPRKTRRIAAYNDVTLDKMSQFFGLFNAVIFAPEDLLLIKEGPTVRRRFLDLLISQVRPTYFHDLQIYSRLLLQRNRTLKLLRTAYGAHRLTAEEEAEIEVWDYSMAPVSAGIIRERIAFSERISSLASEHHHRISSGKEKLFSRYKTVTGLLSEIASIESEEVGPKIEKHLLSRWKATHQEDYDKGITSIGPHRDDLELSLDGEGLRPFASQGQQRSAALALKLAELEIVREETSETPVLLLDDVFSELDAGRRAALLSNIGEAQVFITCTDREFIDKELSPLRPDLFTGDERISFFRIEEGKVFPE
jgi:DNA replication and repair protein RecF